MRQFKPGQLIKMMLRSTHLKTVGLSRKHLTFINFIRGSTSRASLKSLSEQRFKKIKASFSKGNRTFTYQRKCVCRQHEVNKLDTANEKPLMHIDDENE
jgi:phage FluMu protein gp41